MPRNGIGATRILNCGTKRLLLILFVLSFICLSVIPNLTVARIFYIYLEQNDVSVVLDNYYDLPRQPEHEDKLKNKSMNTTMTRNPSASNVVVARPTPIAVVEYISDFTAKHHPIDELIREKNKNLSTYFQFYETLWSRWWTRRKYHRLQH